MYFITTMSFVLGLDQFRPDINLIHLEHYFKIMHPIPVFF
jgi:hypothetical protein